MSEGFQAGGYPLFRLTITSPSLKVIALTTAHLGACNIITTSFRAQIVAVPPLSMRQPIRSTCLLILGCLLVFLLYSHYERGVKSPAPAYHGPFVANTSEATQGLMPLEAAQEFCRRRRWDVYRTRDRPRKVYDMFLISTELDWLEVRLYELYEEVDYFIILEAASTFQEGSKPLHLLDNWSRFQQFHPKMIHHVVNFTGANLAEGDTWEHERFTRNALFYQGLLSLSGQHAPAQGDVLLVADVDEIPRISTIRALRNCAYPPRVTLHSQFYYYSFQWQHRGEQWAHPQATYYNGPYSTIRPEDLRSGEADAELFNAGWHCSSCMPSLKDLVTKITSFSHKSYNQPYFTDRNRLLKVVRQGVDLFEREGEIYDRIDDNPDVPSYLKGTEAQKKFAYMIDRDTESANFQDSARTGSV